MHHSIHKLIIALYVGSQTLPVQSRRLGGRTLVIEEGQHSRQLDQKSDYERIARLMYNAYNKQCTELVSKENKILIRCKEESSGKRGLLLIENIDGPTPVAMRLCDKACTLVDLRVTDPYEQAKTALQEQFSNTGSPTTAPTDTPTTASPTDIPSTLSPSTEAGTTASPTTAPSNDGTSDPTTQLPTTYSPTTDLPSTAQPTTSTDPTTSEPSDYPTTLSPTDAPTISPTFVQTTSSTPEEKIAPSTNTSTSKEDSANNGGGSAVGGIIGIIVLLLALGGGGWYWKKEISDAAKKSGFCCCTGVGEKSDDDHKSEDGNETDHNSVDEDEDEEYGQFQVQPGNSQTVSVSGKNAFRASMNSVFEYIEDIFDDNRTINDVADYKYDDPVEKKTDINEQRASRAGPYLYDYDQEARRSGFSLFD